MCNELSKKLVNSKQKKYFDELVLTKTMCPGFFWSFSQNYDYLPVKIDSAEYSLTLASNPHKFNRKNICSRLMIRPILGRKHMCSAHY
jgi:hypothetical protein